MPDKTLTQNDLSELIDLLQRTVAVTKSDGPAQGMHGYSRESMDILDNLMGRVPSFENTVIGPVLQQIMRLGAKPFIERAKAIGDRYGAQVETDIENNRYNRISVLLKLSIINQLRLMYSKEQSFSELRNYVVQKYQADIADTEGVYGFLPSRSEQTTVLWDVADSLVKTGVATVVEDVELHSGMKATIIKMERTVS